MNDYELHIQELEQTVRECDAELAMAEARERALLRLIEYQTSHIAGLMEDSHEH